MALKEEIQSLILLGAEGEYWDFKEKWHENKASLLHDIICMANNQVGRDAYLIMGVSDSKSPDGVKIKGVLEDNRKDQQHLIDFLRDKKFVGSIRPSVYLQTIELPDDSGVYQPIDLVIIKDSKQTPFFLRENFRDKDKELRAGYIYTRIGDTNTAIDSMADLDKIEYLWRKRFGIDLSATEKLLLLLDHPDEWVGDLNNGEWKYHKFFPEYQIQLVDIEDQSRFSDNSIMKNIADHQCDKCFSVSDVVITCHSTVLFREHVLYLDGYRHLIPFPETHTVYTDELLAKDPSVTYMYLSLDTIPGKLFTNLACIEHNWYYEKWDLRPGVGFLVFETESQRALFDAFVKSHLQEIEDDYTQALREKQYVQCASADDYFRGGWSKANEIKSWHLYEKFMGLLGSSLVDKLPEFQSTGE